MTGGRVEQEFDENGQLTSQWTHDANHGPWQATAPGWAVREFAQVKEMVRDGRWKGNHPVSGLIEGHLVHCDGLWVDGETLSEPEKNVYYEATVRWSNGDVGPLLLWRGSLGGAVKQPEPEPETSQEEPDPDPWCTTPDPAPQNEITTYVETDWHSGKDPK